MDLAGDNDSECALISGSSLGMINNSAHPRTWLDPSEMPKRSHTKKIGMGRVVYPIKLLLYECGFQYFSKPVMGDQRHNFRKVLDHAFIFESPVQRAQYKTFDLGAAS